MKREFSFLSKFLFRKWIDVFVGNDKLRNRWVLSKIDLQTPLNIQQTLQRVTFYMCVLQICIWLQTWVNANKSLIIQIKLSQDYRWLLTFCLHYFARFLKGTRFSIYVTFHYLSRLNIGCWENFYASLVCRKQKQIGSCSSSNDSHKGNIKIANSLPAFLVHRHKHRFCSENGPNYNEIQVISTKKLDCNKLW